MTVGQCALVIVERVAARHFGAPDPPDDVIPQPGQSPNAAAEVRAWHAELLKKGERRMLAEAAARADANSLRQATRLVETYPDEALAPLIAGCRAARNDDSLRTQLIVLVGRLSSKPAEDFLLERLEAERAPLARLATAEGLRRHGRPEGVPVMIKRWQELRQAPPNGSSADDRRGVAEFLVRCECVEAVKALAAGFAEQPGEIRVTIVLALKESAGVNAPSPDDDAALRAAIVELLVAALDDVLHSSSRPWGQGVQIARVCDDAGEALHKIDPKRFPYDSDNWYRTRDSSRVILKNVWLREHGQPELPLPEDEHGHPADESQPTEEQ
jgi:hypothetical protein